MKKVVLGLAIVVVGVGLYGLGWISHRSSDKDVAVPAVSSAPVAAKTLPEAATPPPPPAKPWITQTEWSLLRQGRESVLRNNPDMLDDYKQLLASMDANQKKLDEAMIKADPKVAPLIAKLLILRQHNSVPGPGATKPAVAAAAATEPLPTLSADDWQEIRAARAEALLDNPSLAATADKLRQKIGALNDKIDAAMLKGDPNLAPLVAKVEANRPASSQPVGAAAAPSHEGK